MAWCRGGCGPPLSARPWCSSPSASWTANRVLDLVEADTANQFVRHLAEATLTLVLYCDAVRVNRGRLRHESALPTRLLGIGPPSPSWPVPLAGLALFPQLDLWTAAALATMLAPTDAALGLTTSPQWGDVRAPARCDGAFGRP